MPCSLLFQEWDACFSFVTVWVHSYLGGKIWNSSQNYGTECGLLSNLNYCGKETQLTWATINRENMDNPALSTTSNPIDCDVSTTNCNRVNQNSVHTLFSWLLSQVMPAWFTEEWQKKNSFAQQGLRMESGTKPALLFLTLNFCLHKCI